jgi:site-specific DNA-methyltransferase (adenine-specific)
MKDMPAGSFDGLITDPPYCSGGSGASAKTASPTQKYTSVKSVEKTHKPDFVGDTKDSRSYFHWSIAWLYAARRILKDGAPVMIFSDWRQLPTLTDAIQIADFIWRGIAVWDKRNSFPHYGRFRQDAEFIIWGSKGAMPLDRDCSSRVLPGCYSVPSISAGKRLHITEKPVELLRQLANIVTPGGSIIDPFCGSGSTIEAAILDGFDATGIELTHEYAEIARARIQKVLEKYEKNC